LQYTLNISQKAASIRNSARWEGGFITIFQALLPLSLC